MFVTNPHMETKDSHKCGRRNKDLQSKKKYIFQIEEKLFHRNPKKYIFLGKMLWYNIKNNIKLIYIILNYLYIDKELHIY